MALAACSHTEPGVEVRTIEVVREIQRPCPGTTPVRPEPLGELPEHAQPALAAVLAKLSEYAAPGQYADRAEAYFTTCPPSE